MTKTDALIDAKDTVILGDLESSCTLCNLAYFSNAAIADFTSAKGRNQGP